MQAKMHVFNAQSKLKFFQRTLTRLAIKGTDRVKYGPSRGGRSHEEARQPKNEINFTQSWVQLSQKASY